MSEDIHELHAQGPEEYLKTIEKGELRDAFRKISYAPTKPQFNVYLAAQVKDGDYAFLSSTKEVGELLAYGGGDVHHIFPKNYLSKLGDFNGQKVANCAYTGLETNRSIASKPPKEYMCDIR